MYNMYNSHQLSEPNATYNVHIARDRQVIASGELQRGDAGSMNQGPREGYRARESHPSQRSRRWLRPTPKKIEQ